MKIKNKYKGNLGVQIAHTISKINNNIRYSIRVAPTEQEKKRMRAMTHGLNKYFHNVNVEFLRKLKIAVYQINDERSNLSRLDEILLLD